MKLKSVPLIAKVQQKKTGYSGTHKFEDKKTINYWRETRVEPPAYTQRRDPTATPPECEIKTKPNQMG